MVWGYKENVILLWLRLEREDGPEPVSLRAWSTQGEELKPWVGGIALVSIP